MILAVALLLLTAVVAIDQSAKAVVARLPVAHSNTVGVVRPLPNRTALICRLPNHAGVLVLWGLVLVSAAAVGLRLGLPARDPAATLGLACALGGAASNLVDRCHRGAVVDFIALGWWPAFNTADAAITVGAAVAVLSLSRGLPGG